MSRVDEGLIRELCQQVKYLPGCACEIGVYTGESAKLICDLLPTCTVHLFDSLGIPESMWTECDGHKPGDFKSTEETIRQNLKGRKNYELYIGIFPETAVKVSQEVKFKFAHVDCDVAKTAEAACEWLWPRLVAGGVVLFDDYGSSLCQGLRAVVDKWTGHLCQKGRIATIHRRGSRLWVDKI